jgi:hypothetical protein
MFRTEIMEMRKKRGAGTMNMASKKEKLSVETLEKVSGGAGEDWEEIARRMYDNTDHEIENDITKVPDLDNPHSKKLKGKLYR